MDSLCFDDNKEDIEDKSAEESSTVEVDDKFGNPEVVPRVGDQYQAEIPSLIAAPYLSQLIKKTRDSEIKVNLSQSFSLGLPIPLMWAHCVFESSCGTLESVTSQRKQVISENECPKVKVEHHTALLGEGKIVGRFSNFQSSSKCDETGINLKTKLDQSEGKYLLPGLLVNQSWTDIEYNSFLLGLYVFGKNLNFLKRFVGSKNMGDIQSFYYGKFYRSKGYCRWSECRKLRTRRCIYGQKIFTGWRQQELLSRLFSHVSGECQTMLVEISRDFAEGRMPFEDYVFALKDAVGIHLLIAAVGIGKGKQDLTGTAVEPTKTNHVFSLRPEIPIGKACSSLTSADIIKFLTGNFRLSKARSSDLFWEAVWPRLLAKGWHSEQPKDHIASGSKQSLVFLVPGVKKFSRRRLVKGDHYFDSVSDVLNKVASDPGLLGTEIQAIEGSVDRENRLDKRDLDGVSNRQQLRYLQPVSSKGNQNLVKFTIVDTSMVHDMDQRKVRQLRSLPFQTVSISTISSCSSEFEQVTSEDSEDQVEQASASNPIEDPVEHASASYPTENQVEQANALYPTEDQVEQANSSNNIEDIVEQASASYLIEDQVEQASASYLIEDQIEQASASYPIEDQVGQANTSYPIEDQVEQANSSNPIEEVSKGVPIEEVSKGVSIDSSDCTRIREAFSATKVEVENHKHRSDLHYDKHSKEINEHQFIQKMTSDCSNYFPYTKMHKLRACNHGEFSHCTDSTSSMDRKFDLNEPTFPSSLHEASEGMVLSLGSENVSFPSYLDKGSPNMSNEGSATVNHMVGEVSAEKSETRMLIDLNFPQVSPELGIEMEMPSSMVILQNDNQWANTSSSLSEITHLNEMQEFPGGHKEQQSIIVNRRQSTRNRPLTTKALEALEYRFLNSKRKRKNTETSDRNSKSRSLRVSSGTIVTATCENGIGNAMADTREEEENVIQAFSYSINLNSEAHFNL